MLGDHKFQYEELQGIFSKNGLESYAVEKGGSRVCGREDIHILAELNSLDDPLDLADKVSCVASHKLAVEYME